MSKINLYVDDTMLPSNKFISQPDIIIFGGVLIPESEVSKIDKLMIDIKKNYTQIYMPLKYNFRDVQNVYKKHGRLTEYASIIADSKKWRLNIIDKAKNIDYKIIASVVMQNYLTSKTKEAVFRYGLSNVLMRVGLYAKKQSKSEIQLIMDWPGGDNPEPIISEYLCGYYNGKTQDKNVNYTCGKLSNLNFNESIYFTRCIHSNQMQFTDLIVGAIRDCIKTKLNDLTKTSVGCEMFEKFENKFDCYPGYFTKGLTVSSSNPTLVKNVRNIINSFQP